MLKMNPGDKVYCYKSNHRFQKGRCYEVGGINENEITLLVNSFHIYHFSLNNTHRPMYLSGRFQDFFYYKSTLRKKKLEKLNEKGR